MGLNDEKHRQINAKPFTKKPYSLLIPFVMIVLGFFNPCFANPLSNIMLLFQKDLKIDVTYENHKNLIQGSSVYWAEDLKQEQRVLIGEVQRVSLDESQQSRVEIIIHKKYKDKIYATTPFVLMGSLFSSTPEAYIMAVSSLDSSDTTPMESGASVKGLTFLEYKMAVVGQEISKVMERFKKQNKELLSQLEQYIDTLDTEAFHKKINELGKHMSQFSAEQKEAFKKDVLPALRKMVESITKKLEEQNNMEKSKDLEKQLKQIEKMVEV